MRINRKERGPQRRGYIQPPALASEALGVERAVWKSAVYLLGIHVIIVNLQGRYPDFATHPDLQSPPRVTTFHA